VALPWQVPRLQPALEMTAATSVWKVTGAAGNESATASQRAAREDHWRRVAEFTVKK